MDDPLRKLDAYSAAEWQQAAHLSSAIRHYKNILDTNNSHHDFDSQLRLKRHESWLRCALATLLKTATAENVCLRWSHFADENILAAYKQHEGDKHNLAIFALGKLGALELNLSSDVDIVFLTSDPITESHFKCARNIISSLSAVTGLGFVHRVDTDLKPGGRLAPIVSSLKQMQDYYWSNGETWERLALTRARPVCGPKNLIEATTDIFKKFSYRKYIDYTLLGDLKLLRQKIHHHIFPRAENKFHLKLSPGGIRDIELFIHALLIIHGGRNKLLQEHSTSRAIYKLQESKLFPHDELDFLKNTYWSYRQIENELQAISDEQTHVCTDATQLEKIKTWATRVDTIVQNIIGDTKKASLLPIDSEAQQSWLKDLGFDENICHELWPQIMSLTALSLKSSEDELVRHQVLHEFVTQIHKHALDKNLALHLLHDFFKSIRAKATFFSTLLREPRLIQDLALLFGVSAYHGHTIASRPELLDALLQPMEFSPVADWGPYLESLAERKLLREIIISKNFLLNRSLEALNAGLSDVADSIVHDLYNKLRNELNLNDIHIVALGKWGGREVGIKSDLDFIFIAENAITELHHRFAKRFIGRMTEQHRGGSLYSIDLRLRPSGKAGPIIVNKQSLHDYLSQQAAAWERQTYLKARTVTPIQLDLISSIMHRDLTPEDIKELAAIRMQLVKNTSETIDLKLAPGGIADIELAAQAALLQIKLRPESPATDSMIATLTEQNKNWGTYGPQLLKIYQQLRQYEQLNQIIAGQSGSQILQHNDSARRVAQFLGLNETQFISNTLSILNESSAILKQLDPRQCEK